MLLGRAEESAVIDQLLANARQGGSGAIVIKGEAGIGKSALLDHATQLASGMRVLRISGVETEAEIAFGTLHLLLHAELALVESLPQLQAAALRAALGEAPAQAADGLLVGLAVLTLLSDMAEQTPLLVLLDDAQWFDKPSASALSFAARRLAHDGIVMIFAVRDGERAFAGDGLPELRLTRLDDSDASTFLVERRPALPVNLRRRVIEEAAGNPLALLELSGTLTTGRPSQGVPVSGALVSPTKVSGEVRVFGDQIERLPEATQSLLLVAAADDTGDVVRVLAASRTFQANAEDLEPAERAGLIMVDAGTVSFRHPLIRAAAYHGPPFGRRLAAHAALAATCESPNQADRHAWHCAASVVEPDDDVSAELEGAAERAESRGGHATAASAYERAAALSVQESTRVRRLGRAAWRPTMLASCRMQQSCFSDFRHPIRIRPPEPRSCRLLLQWSSNTDRPGRLPASSSMPRRHSGLVIRPRPEPCLAQPWAWCWSPATQSWPSRSSQLSTHCRWVENRASLRGSLECAGWPCCCATNLKQRCTCLPEPAPAPGQMSWPSVHHGPFCSRPMPPQRSAMTTRCMP